MVKILKRSITPPKVTGLKDDILNELVFTINDKYDCICYCMDYTQNDEYSLRILNNGKEIYSARIDSTLGMVAGNDETYTDKDIQSIIDEAFKTISEYIIAF